MADSTASSIPEPPADPAVAGLDRKLEEARKELLETSTRSRLLNTPIGSARAKIVEVKNELSEEVFRILVAEGKSMSFSPAPPTGREAADGTIELPQPDEQPGPDGLVPSHVDTRLQTALSSEKLQTRLRSIAYDAKSIEDEQGVNILYLALGFLVWSDPSDQGRLFHAPLLLVPVTLARESAAQMFKVSYSGEELATNLSLQQRLLADGVQLPELSESEDISPTSYFAAVERAIVGRTGWAVRGDTIVLGFFSFAKLLMYRDLEPERWPLKDGLRDHPLVNGLLGDGFRFDGGVPLLPEDEPADGVVDICTAAHVVDADSSQMLAIEEVQRGRNLVIQGPPGTGKSQTLTNLIASAVSQGKQVLFVAEKMAALNVVRANMDRIGLGQMCLELHSHKTKKKAVLDDLQETHGLQAALHTGAVDTAELRRTRDAVNTHARRMHTPLAPSSMTPYEVFGGLSRLVGSGVPAPDFQLPAASGWTRPEVEERLAAVQRLANHVATMGPPAAHPWRTSKLGAVLPQDAERHARRATLVSTALGDLAEAALATAAVAGVPGVSFQDVQRLTTLAGAVGGAPRVDPSAIANVAWTDQRTAIQALLDVGTTYANARRRLEPVLIPEAWEEDLSEVRRAFLAHGHSWLRWLRREYREAVYRMRGLHVGPLPKMVATRLEILHVLAAGQKARTQLRDMDAVGRGAFGSLWMGERSDWSHVRMVEAWEARCSMLDLPSQWRRALAAMGDFRAFAAMGETIAQRLNQTRSNVDAFIVELQMDAAAALGASDVGVIPLNDLQSWTSAMGAFPEGLPQWLTWRLWSAEVRAKGLDSIVDRLADGRLEPGAAVSSARFACLETIARQAFNELPELGTFDGRGHQGIVDRFRDLDCARLELARREVAAQHVLMIPRADGNLGEMGILAWEWRKQRKHLPLRQLIKKAGRAMQRIKPVWMMSPLSLAQFVEPGALRFDLVLMDEASQVRPVEALGAVARAKQMVVAGDEKQLPPTSFFDRVAAGDEEAEASEEAQAADVESILGLCLAQGLPDRMLRWHYRSQHESLIAVSNLEFYRKLFIVPSADSQGLGLRLRAVKGIYDRGRTRVNRIEAREVARAVIEHAREYRSAERYPNGMTLGVGAFSVAQRDAILDELEVLWRDNEDVREFFSLNAPEPFFVKNLESIQGDERDVVFISVGYGPDESGYTAMSFGPLNLQGGERRLNVLISRARRRCEVFSALTAADIDLAKTQSAGVRVLKTFLQYAETGHLDRSQVVDRPPDSDFELDIAAALTAAGYDVVHQVGVAGFFVDLAIRDAERPGRYVLGIECDGATYHRSRSARDRDRLREQVLRDRGWRIHRIWSTDWFKRRQHELRRTVEAIEAARLAGPVLAAPAAKPAATSLAEPLLVEPAPAVIATSDSRPASPTASKRYAATDLKHRSSTEPHEIGMSVRVDMVCQIVADEGPIHADEVGRRFAMVCGNDRAGSRIQRAVRDALRSAARSGRVHVADDFYTAAPIDSCQPRDRSNVPYQSVRDPKMLPPVELRTGLLSVATEHLGVDPKDAVAAVARMLGFERTGQELQRVIEEQLRLLLANGTLVLRHDNRLYPPEKGS